MDNWTFAPEEVSSEAEESTLFANILFNPGIFHPASVPLPPELKSPPGNRDGFMAPRVSAAHYAQYPINSVATGTVVLDVTVSKIGHVSAASPVYAVPSLTKSAMDAVKTWTFKPGTFRRIPITARTIVAFVFRSPTISIP